MIFHPGAAAAAEREALPGEAPVRLRVTVMPDHRGVQLWLQTLDHIQPVADVGVQARGRVARG